MKIFKQLFLYFKILRQLERRLNQLPDFITKTLSG